VFWYENAGGTRADAGLNALLHSRDGVHVGFRPAEQKIVLNIRRNGRWGEEQNAVRAMIPGLFELSLVPQSGVTLHLGDRELLSMPLANDAEFPWDAFSNVAAYGEIDVLTVEGEIVRGQVPISRVLHSEESVVLSSLRKCTQDQEAAGADGRERDALVAHIHGQLRALIGSLRHFDLQRYVDLNPDLRGRFASRGEALADFIADGVGRVRQFDEDNIFDPVFYTTRYDDVSTLSPPAAYVHWLTSGRAEGRPPSEEKLLQRLGISLAAIPPSFSAERYRWESGSPAQPFATKWEAFEHWIGRIAATPTLLAPIDDTSACAQIYKDVADSHAKRGTDGKAIGLYWQALILNPNQPQAWQHLGDALLRSGRFGEAHHAYSQAQGGGYYFSSHNLIQAERGLNRIGKALERARHLQATAPEKIQPTELAEELASQIFETTRQRAKSLVRESRREEAIALVRSGFSDADLAEFDRASIPVNRRARPQVVIFGTPHLRQCIFYRIEQKLEQLADAGFAADFIPQDDTRGLMSRIGDYDAAIFYRVPALPEIEKAIVHARKSGIPTFYEIDDLVFDPRYFPDSIENYRGQVNDDEYANLVVDAPLFERAMSLCEYGIASTPTLQHLLKHVVARKLCFLHRNVMDSRHQRFAERQAQFGQRRPSEPVTLFYASGTRAHNEDFELFAVPAIAELFRSRPDLRLVLMGHLPLPAGLAPYEHRIVRLPVVWDTNAFWSALAQADINLSVLKPGIISDSKSEIKWLEAAMLGIPSVVSATATHTEILSDGVDVMLADSVESWERKLSALVDSPKLRTRIGMRARELVHSKYAPQAGAGSIAAIMESVSDERRKGAGSKADKPLILVVNAFFWPQMIGGATRVVRDNIDWFRDHASDAFEFQAFCAVEGARRPYETRTHLYRGMRVASVTHPMRAGMDWEPADEEMGRIFRAYLERWRPALIHFHCIQRLSVCIAEAALELGIPYIVTVHDGWWISDHQFLVDQKGKLVTPESSNPIASILDGEASAAAKINRGLRLRAALSSAERVVAVSPAFEAVYRSHGVASNIVTIANGVSKLPKAARRPSADGRIRLGFVGGLSDHKGYGLIRRALRSTPFERLSLTIVDHSLSHGEKGPAQVWGTTPVRTIGKFPQDRVVELYENLDVLLAPSIWPESFGLVVREALMCGLWVVASNRGAVGDDVMPDINGFVVDVADTRELVDALGRIDQDPARYGSSPGHAPDFRTSAGQAEDLVHLYRQLLSRQSPVRARPELQQDISLREVL